MCNICIPYIYFIQAFIQNTQIFLYLLRLPDDCYHSLNSQIRGIMPPMIHVVPSIYMDPGFPRRYVVILSYLTPYIS